MRFEIKPWMTERIFGAPDWVVVQVDKCIHSETQTSAAENTEKITIAARNKRTLRHQRVHASYIIVDVARATFGVRFLNDFGDKS